MRFTLLALLSFLCTCGPAQMLAQDTFEQLRDTMGMQLYPVDGVTFREEKNKANDYLDSHRTLYSRSEKTEVRLHLRPLQPNDPLGNMVRLRTHALAINLGSNDEDAVTSVHFFGEEELSALNADWARMYTLRPKRSYSEWRHAQLIAVYRADRGLAYTVLLFDRSPGRLEDLQLLLRFL